MQYTSQTKGFDRNITFEVHPDALFYINRLWRANAETFLPLPPSTTPNTFWCIQP